MCELPPEMTNYLRLKEKKISWKSQNLVGL